MSTTYCNTQEDPVITAGYSGPVSLSSDARQLRRTEFDPANALRAAALYFAETAGLKLDTEFFQDEVPADSGNVLALTLDGTAGSSAGCDYRQIRLILTGRDVNGGTLHRHFDRIRSRLADPGWITVSGNHISGSVTFAAWEIRGMQFADSSHAGRRFRTGKMEITANIVLVPPQEEESESSDSSSGGSQS